MATVALTAGSVVASTESAVDQDVIGWPALAASLSMVAITLAVGWAMRLHIGRQIVVACVRAAVQLLAVGFLFNYLFESSAATWLAYGWIALMIVVATTVVVRRSHHRVHRLGEITFATMLGSTAVSLLVVFGFGVIDATPVTLVVVAGITLGNTVPSAVLAVNQAHEQSHIRQGEIEAVLSLGFTRRQVTQFMAPRPTNNALIPQVERTKVVGLIALPGAMTGLLLAGVDPVQAVVVQLLVMYLVLGTGALCVVVVVLAIVGRSVSDDLRLAEWVREHDG